MAAPRHPNAPFWDFINSFDPNPAHGPGVDRNAGPPPDFFGPGFPFNFRFGVPTHGGPPGPWDHWDQWYRQQDAGHPGWGRPRGNREDPATTVDENQPQEAGDSAAAPVELNNDNKEDSPETMDVPDPAEVTPEDSDGDFSPFERCQLPGPDFRPRRGRGRGHGHRGGPGRCGRGGFRRGHHFGPPPPPPPPPHEHGHHGHRHGDGPHPFDFSGFMRGLAEQLGNYAAAAVPNTNNNNTRGADGNADAFEPPVDIFNTDRAYVLHVALPGARKEDVGVSWDPEAGVLRIAGVIHRPGDEAFLQTLATSERRVGMFERAIPLPPADSATKDEIDGYGITAKMEDGVLVVTVPKAEKEWTEVHKVDIE